MRISDMIASYINEPKLKAKLKQEIKLDDGTVFEAGTVSELLIKKHDGSYHFESLNSACTVKVEEIEFITY